MDVLKTISLITSLVEPMLVPSNTVPSSSIKYAFMTPPFLLCSCSFPIWDWKFISAQIFTILSCGEKFFNWFFWNFSRNCLWKLWQANQRCPGVKFWIMLTRLMGIFLAAKQKYILYFFVMSFFQISISNRYLVLFWLLILDLFFVGSICSDIIKSCLYCGKMVKWILIKERFENSPDTDGRYLSYSENRL